MTKGHNKADWLEWINENAPSSHRGPQPTRAGYKLLALYVASKQACKRAMCFAVNHKIETEDWDGEELNLRRINWQCTRCGQGGTTK